MSKAEAELDPYTCGGCDVSLWCASMSHTLEDCEADCTYWTANPLDQSAWCCMACPANECNGGADCEECACHEAEAEANEAEGGGMNPREALKVITEYVNDASSFAETFEGIPDAFGDPDRPIATGEGLDTALRSLADFLDEEPVAEMLDKPEPHERFEAVLELLRGRIVDLGGWGVPADMEDEWSPADYRADLTDAILTLEGARDA